MSVSAKSDSHAPGDQLAIRRAGHDWSAPSTWNVVGGSRGIGGAGTKSVAAPSLARPQSVGRRWPHAPQRGRGASEVEGRAPMRAEYRLRGGRLPRISLVRNRSGPPPAVTEGSRSVPGSSARDRRTLRLGGRADPNSSKRWEIAPSPPVPARHLVERSVKDALGRTPPGRIR
jgi:hypothetical protein